MKKILKNLIFLLLPVLLYYGLFLALEPNNYFGLRGETPSGAAIGTLRDYQANPAPNVIIGDSRFAHLDMEQVGEITGEHWANLSFGGASLTEQLDRVDWLVDRYEVETIAFELSFYTLNAAYTNDRTKSIEDSLENPFVYLTSLNFHIEVIENLTFLLRGLELGGGEAETRDPATYTYAEYLNPATGETKVLRQDIIEYLGYIEDYVTGWSLNVAALERLEATIAACREKGIQFVLVLPPMHESLLTEAVQAYGIESTMLDVIERLQGSGALLLDYEFTNRPSFAEDMFFDGLHLDYERGRPVWTEMLFADIAQGLQAQ